MLFKACPLFRMSAIGKFHCIYIRYLRNDVAQLERDNGIFQHKN